MKEDNRIVVALKSWIEVEETFLTNQPLIYVGRGRARKQIPDPERPATEATFFIYRCTRGKRGVVRSRTAHFLRADSKAALDSAIRAFLQRSDAVPIPNQDRPLEYEAFRGEPTPLVVDEPRAH